MVEGNCDIERATWSPPAKVQKKISKDKKLYVAVAENIHDFINF